MSFISTVQPAHLADMSPVHLDRGFAAEAPTSPSSSLSTGLEITLLLATLSGISLVLCTIIAGAF